MFRINLFIIILLTAFSLNAQLRVNIGGHLGGGTIKGESPSVGSFNASLFIETNTVLFAEVTPRLGYFFAKDFNVLLPNSRKAYFPYMQGIYFKGITTQYFSGKIFLEEGVGLLAINDRTFNDTNLWAYGAKSARSSRDSWRATTWPESSVPQPSFRQGNWSPEDPFAHMASQSPEWSPRRSCS